MAQQAAVPESVVILPFENTSKAPGIEWISEAFPQILGERLASERFAAASREERLYAYERLGVPAHIRPSLATLFRIAQAMDADYLVVGRYDFDGSNFTASAQVLDMKQRRLSDEASHSGPLVNLIEVQTALAWEVLRMLPGQVMQSRDEFVAAFPLVRLDAFENYVRGTMATQHQEKVKYFREALRLHPAYAAAALALGKEYFARRDYRGAIPWLEQAGHDQREAREAGFLLGLASFYSHDLERAHRAFLRLAEETQLAEAYNNAGVAMSRQGKSAAEFFRKALASEDRDADYHFNLGIALFRGGDAAGAARHLRESLALRPADSEARAMLQAAAPGGRQPERMPLVRIKPSYDEALFRQNEAASGTAAAETPTREP